MKADSHLYSWQSAHPFSERVAGFALERIPMLDPESFTIGGIRCAASDSRRAYQFSEDGRIVDIRPLPGQGKVYQEYSVIDGVAYWHASALKGADAATFRAPASGCGGNYGVDAHHVYSADHVLEGADAATFGCFSGTDFAKDSLRGYVHGEPIAGSDGATFELVPEVSGCQERFARDARRVYWRAIPFPGADPKTFEQMNFTSSASGQTLCAATDRDSQHVYYQLRPTGEGNVYVVEGADPATYVPLDFGFGYDRNHAYRFGRLLGDKERAEFEAVRTAAAAASHSQH